MLIVQEPDIVQVNGKSIKSTGNMVSQLVKRPLINQSEGLFQNDILMFPVNLHMIWTQLS